MNAYEINKFLGAGLGALVFIMGLSVLSEIIFTEEPPAEPGYLVAVAEPEDAEGEAADAAEPTLAVLLASADPANGEGAAAICGACHSFDDARANGIGPYLHGVVGRPIAAVDGFAYSGALEAHAEGQGWTYEELDGFLEAPQSWVPGTIMAYAGIKDPQERADVIAYLAAVTPDAPPFPEPEAPAAPAEEPVETAAATAAAPDAPEVPAADAAETEAPVDGEATEMADAAPAAGDAPPAEIVGELDPEFAALLASADADVGSQNVAICSACHAFEKGGPNKIGPVLWDSVGREIASVEGFAYSEPMQAHAAEAGVWSYAQLDGYLENPMGLVPGTNMAFAGVKDAEIRAHIIAYLASLSDEPYGLPQPGAAPEAAEVAEGEPTPDDAPSVETVAAPTESEAAAAPDGAGAPGATAGDGATAPADGEARSAVTEDEAPVAAAETGAPADQATTPQEADMAVAQAATPPADTEPATAEPSAEEVAVRALSAAARGEEPSAEAEAEELVEEAETAGAAGRQEGEGEGTEAVQNVEEVAADEIAAGDVDPEGAGARQALEAEDVIGDRDEDIGQLVSPGEAQDLDTPNTQQAGAGTDRVDDPGEAVPAEAATDVRSEALVAEPLDPQVGNVTGHTDAAVEVPMDPEPDAVPREGTGEAQREAVLAVEPTDDEADTDGTGEGVATVAATDEVGSTASVPVQPVETDARPTATGSNIVIQPAERARVEIVNPRRRAE